MLGDDGHSAAAIDRQLSPSEISLIPCDEMLECSDAKMVVTDVQSLGEWLSHSRCLTGRGWECDLDVASMMDVRWMLGGCQVDAHEYGVLLVVGSDAVLSSADVANDVRG
mmetsp:Transcript_7125/g.19333  ORF Transcript_7125/g.19333 Transcript_7125/m.19333 type:complete len:110 (+) Transcript_7125:973-1302(+)